MIFARRAIQNRLDQLRTTLGDESIQKLADRLNTPGKDRLAAMWEVVTFQGLSKLGALRHELPLETGRKPDIHFKSNDLEITADVTTVSDDGLHEINPAQKLQELIYEQQVKLGLPDAGMHLDIDYREERSNRGVKTKLCLPQAKRLPELVRNEIVPKLKEQIDAGARVLHVPIKNETTSLRITIDPSKPTFSTMSYASYTSPSIRDKNPLYEALKAKAKQLRKAPGIVGVIVGDSSTGTLAQPMTGSNALTARAIAEEFLRQHSSVGFVLLISVREEQHTWYQARERKMWLEVDLVPTLPDDTSAKLEALFRGMLDAFPIPVNMPINASHRAKESGFGWGYHGGFRMSGKRARFSAREILEVLAGQRTAEEINEQHKALHGSGHSISMPQWIDAQLRAGRLPSSMSIIKTDENENDDWIEFEFGPPDAAITPFR